MHRIRWGVALVAVACTVALPAGALAEEPLGDLVHFPPHVDAHQRTVPPVMDFLVDEAGVVASDVVEHGPVAVARQGGDTSLFWVHGYRFVDADRAETAALTLAGRDFAELTVYELGTTLGEGVVLSSRGPGVQGTVHDAVRVRGRDLFLITATSSGTSEIPEELLDAVVWHADRFPGSTRPVDGSRGLLRTGWILIGLALLGASGSFGLWWRTRGGRPVPPRPAPTPGEVRVLW